MAFELAPLPYAMGALAPFLSVASMELHYGKHHQAYVTKLNELVAGTEYEGLSLEEVIRKSRQRPDLEAIQQNAGQHWNHTFFWRSMSPARTEPSGRLLERIEADFGSTAQLRSTFLREGLKQFGSGWIWIVEKPSNDLAVIKTSNAENPLLSGDNPLLCCDVWEHAYYVDYQNRRAAFLEIFFDQLADWQGAASRLKAV